MPVLVQSIHLQTVHFLTPPVLLVLDFPPVQTNREGFSDIGKVCFGKLRHWAFLSSTLQSSVVLSLAVPESVPLPGDRCPGSSFIDYLFRLEQQLDCKMQIRLGDVKAIEEYRAIGAGNKYHQGAFCSMRKTEFIVLDTPKELLQAGKRWIEKVPPFIPMDYKW